MSFITDCPVLKTKHHKLKLKKVLLSCLCSMQPTSQLWKQIIINENICTQYSKYKHILADMTVSSAALSCRENSFMMPSLGI